MKKRKTVVILGDKGMLGHVVKRYFEKLDKYNVIGLNRKDIDFTDYIKLDTKLIECNPDYVINCAGILNNDSGKDIYTNVNIILPKMLEYLSTQDGHKFKIIHVSTNCIYKDIGPHDVNEQFTATNLYGISKALGEIDSKKHLTIRTSIIGPECQKKKGYTGLMHQYIINKKFKTGFKNIFWNGVTTLELAKFIENNMHKLTGVKNYCTKDTITKYDILAILDFVFKVYKYPKEIITTAHQSLLKSKYVSKKDIYKQLWDLKNFMCDNKDLYKKVYKKEVLK